MGQGRQVRGPQAEMIVRAAREFHSRRDECRNMPVEQTKLKRAGTGLRAFDRERAWPGFTLFAPYQSVTTTVYLIDLDGNVVHTWPMPYPAQYGRLTERGTLFYNGKTP